MIGDAPPKYILYTVRWNIAFFPNSIALVQSERKGNNAFYPSIGLHTATGICDSQYTLSYVF